MKSSRGFTRLIGIALVCLMLGAIFGGASSVVISAAVAKPSVVSRTEWGCPQGQSSPDWPPEYYAVTHIIIHHTATPNTDTDWPARVRQIWDYHTNTNGWDDIAYNYLVDPNGVIYEGRAGGDDVIGAHAAVLSGESVKPLPGHSTEPQPATDETSYNDGSAGIALLGTFSDIEPTPAALGSVESLIAWICDQKGIDPLSSGPDNDGVEYPYISGHRDVEYTDCPGEGVYSLLPAIRQNVFNIISGNQPPVVSSTSPVDAATDVKVDTVITATFSEAMDGSTINTGSFTLAGSAVSGQVTYNPNTYTATFTPDSNLEYDHDYIATLSTAITDEAGNPLVKPISWSFATQSAPDTTPPTTPLVIADGGPFAGTTELHASWSSSDPESGIAEYQYAVGTSAGGTDVVGWTSVGAATEVSQTASGLSVGTTYYFSVKAKNGQGLWSEVGVGNGIILTAVTLDLPSDWRDKQLFVPVYYRSANTPGAAVIGVHNKRDMWYLVEVFKRQQGDLQWTKYDPPEWTFPYLFPWDEKTFTYTPKLGEEIKIQVWNDLNDNSLRSLYYLDFATRALLGISWSSQVTYPDEFMTECLSLVADIGPSVGYLVQGKVEEALRSLAIKAGEETVAALFQEVLSMAGITASKQVIANAAVSIGVRLLINSPIYIPLLNNTNIEPPMEEIVLTAEAKTQIVPPDIKVTKSLSLIEEEPYYSGEIITAKFTITNRGTTAVKLNYLTAGGRGPRGDADVHDFACATAVTLNLGDSYDYEGKLFLSDIGLYHFFVAYQTSDGQWYSSVATEGLATNTLDIQVGPLPDRLITNICSPGELRVYDSQNRVTGLVNGEVKEEIPDSIYDEQNEIIVIYLPSDTYRYEVVGTDEDTYGLGITFIENGEAVAFDATGVPITTGAKYEYTIDWAALSEGEKGVTIKKDADGDGDFEEEIFTTPPYTPNDPSPSSGATGVSVDTPLSWVGGDPDEEDDVTYKIYFGTSENSPLVSDNGTENSYDPGNLNYDTVYYWEVVTRDNHGIATEGPIWRFSTASPPTSAGGGGGGGGAGVPPGFKGHLPKSTTHLLGMWRNGVMLVRVDPTSGDGLLILRINAGTEVLRQSGEYLNRITIGEIREPPTLPEQATFIGRVYDLLPDGATFDPPITLSIKYDPDEIPEGVMEEDLFIVRLDETSSRWIKVEGTVNPKTHSITTKIDHFSGYAILASTRPAAFTVSNLSITPTEIYAGESANISVLVTNTGYFAGTHEVNLEVDNIVVETIVVTLDSGDSERISFSVTPDTVGERTVNVSGLLGTFKVKAPEAPPTPTPVSAVAPAPVSFAISDLSVTPSEVKLAGQVKISAVVTNTGGGEGSYTVVCKINGAEEARKEITLGVGKSDTVTFTTAKDVAGTYAVKVDGLSGTFAVKPVGALIPTQAKPINWGLISGIIAGCVVVVGLLVYFFVWRKRGALGAILSISTRRRRS